MNLLLCIFAVLLCIHIALGESILASCGRKKHLLRDSVGSNLDILHQIKAGEDNAVGESVSSVRPSL